MSRASSSSRPGPVNSAPTPSARRISRIVRTSRQRGTFSKTDRSGARAAAAITASELFFAPATRSRPRNCRPPVTRSFSVRRSVATASARIGDPPQRHLDVVAHELFEQAVPVDLPDQGPGILVAGNIRWIARDEISDDLIDGIIPAFQQRLVHVPQGFLHVADLAGTGVEYFRLLALTHCLAPVYRHPNTWLRRCNMFLMSEPYQRIAGAVRRRGWLRRP